MLLRYTMGLLTLTLALILAGCAEESSPPTLPNILLIVADDLGYTDLGAFGGEINTPHLDQLALQGVRFSNFHTSASCSPTRAMLLTGTDNHLAGMGSQGGLATPLQKQSPAYANRLSPGVPTFVELMRDAGYRTYMSGKWHLGATADSLPSARGFDRSFALMEGGGGHFDDTPLFKQYGRANWLEDGEPVVLPEDFYSSDEVTERLMSYIEATPQGEPYFAYLAFTAPHWPLQAPAEDIARYRGAYDEGWDVLRAARMAAAKRQAVVAADAQAVDIEAGLEPWSTLDAMAKAEAAARMEVYAAMVDRMDANVGRLLGLLRARGDLANTLVVFISDNGAEAHDMENHPRHGTWLEEQFDNSLGNIGSATSYVALQVGWARAGAVPFRASKSKVSEGGIRVPGFVTLPNTLGGVDAGRVDDAYMRVMDLGPTFLQVAGSQAPASMMGRSLLPRWQGGDAPYAQDEVIAYEVYGRRGAQRGDWKVLLQEAPYGTGEWQLYNLAQDPGEQEDLSAEHPELRQSLIEAWQSYAHSVGVIAPETPIPY